MMGCISCFNLLLACLKSNPVDDKTGHVNLSRDDANNHHCRSSVWTCNNVLECSSFQYSTNEYCSICLTILTWTSAQLVDMSVVTCTLEIRFFFEMSEWDKDETSHISCSFLNQLSKMPPKTELIEGPVWFQLVDHIGRPYRETSADKVTLAPSNIVAQPRDAVKA